jgi:arsenate reductase
MAEDVAAMLAPDIVVERVDVETAEEANRLAFAGSPSFVVNHRDIEGVIGSGRLSCRTYDDGQGLPQRWRLEAAVLRHLGPRGLLFLCVANSARSQLAEGIARQLAPPSVNVWSAGSAPTRVRPEAITVLAEIGIDISGHRSKAVNEIPAEQVDTVITLCGEEECPVFLGRARRLHWGLDDPAAVTSSDTDRLEAFRQTRDELLRRLRRVFDVPHTMATAS